MVSFKDLVELKKQAITDKLPISRRTYGLALTQFLIDNNPSLKGQSLQNAMTETNANIDQEIRSTSVQEISGTTREPLLLQTTATETDLYSEKNILEKLVQLKQKAIADGLPSSKQAYGQALQQHLRDSDATLTGDSLRQAMVVLNKQIDGLIKEQEQIIEDMVVKSDNEVVTFDQDMSSSEALLDIRSLEELIRLVSHSQSIKTLKFAFNFNEPLEFGILPESLESVEFGWEFNQPIQPGILPKSLKTLKLGLSFNQPLEQGVLPKSLETLKLALGSSFNQPLEQGVLPKSLKTLKLGSSFNQPLEQGVLPKSLETLKLGSSFNQPLEQGVLPESLKSLAFGWYFNQPLEQGVLPESLETLKLGWDFNQPLEQGVLPESLETLKLGGDFNQPLEQGVLPVSLKSLAFGSNFNQPLEQGVLPESLKSLAFGSNFNQPLEHGVLPESLETLKLGWKFNQPLEPGVLPLLKDLEIYREIIPSKPYKKDLLKDRSKNKTWDILPDSLRILTVHNANISFLEQVVLPKSLKLLKISYWEGKPPKVKNFKYIGNRLGEDSDETTFGIYISNPIKLDTYITRDPNIQQLIDSDNFNTFIQPYEKILQAREYLRESNFKKYLETLPSRARFPEKTDDGSISYGLDDELNSIVQELNQGPSLKHVELIPVKDEDTIKMIQDSFYDDKKTKKIGGFVHRITSIYRIVNPWTVKEFEKRPRPSDNIVWAWHGTNKAKILSILKNHYFTPKHSKYEPATDTWFGQGVYFAKVGDKSLYYSDSIDEKCFYDLESTGYLIFNMLDLGSDERIYKVPPNRPLVDDEIPLEYDSVYAYGGHNNIARDEIVIRDPERILPVYLVKVECNKELLKGKKSKNLAERLMETGGV